MPWWTRSGQADELIQDWQKPIYNLALRRLGNHADAADLTQEVFVAVLRDRPRLRSAEKLKPWIYRVAHNAISGHLRRRRLRLSKEDQGIEGPLPTRTGEEAAQEAEIHALLQEQIRRLPEEVQAPIILRFYQDLTQAEIGEVLAIPRGTVRSRLDKGLELLKRQLSLAGCAMLVPGLESRLASAPSAPVPEELGAALRALAPASVSGLAAILPTLISAGALSGLAFAGGLMVANPKAEEPSPLASASPGGAEAQVQADSGLAEEERRVFQARIAALERALEDAAGAPARRPEPSRATEPAPRPTRTPRRDPVRALAEAMIALSRKSQTIVAEAPSEEAKSVALAKEITGQARVLFYQLGEHKERALHVFLDVLADPERGEDHLSAGYALTRVARFPTVPEELGRLNERALALGDDPELDPKLRACALTALHLRPDTESHALAYRVLSVLARDPEPLLSEIAALQIATIPMAEARADSLRRLYDLSVKAKQRVGLLYALRLHEDPRGLEALEPVLSDGEALLRANAYLILNELPGSDALRRRLEQAFDAESEAALYLISRPLIHHGDAATAAFLADIASDPSRSLGRRGAASEARKALLKILEKDKRP